VLYSQALIGGCRRLAPIRGIPTKSGDLADPNSDLKEIFDTFESLPSAPIKLAQGFLSWARGEQDPDWKSKGKRPPR
jgi:protein-histidine N-methyltransferase